MTRREEWVSKEPLASPVETMSGTTRPIGERLFPAVSRGNVDDDEALADDTF